MHLILYIPTTTHASWWKFGMGKITLPLKIWRIPIICKFELYGMLRLSVGDNLSERDLTVSWKILEQKSPRNQNTLSDCKSTMTWTEVRLGLCNSKVVEFLDSKEWSKVWMKVHKMIGKVWIFPEKMTLSKFNYFYLQCNLNSMSKNNNMMTDTKCLFLCMSGMQWTLKWDKSRSFYGTFFYRYFFNVIFLIYS